MVRLWGMLIVVLTCSVSTAVAGPLWTPDCFPQKKVCGCPDDYCAKPLPCEPCNKPGCGDNYCAKPLPCAPCPTAGTCDTYCPKPACIRVGIGYGTWFKCFPSKPACGGVVPTQVTAPPDLEVPAAGQPVVKPAP